MVYFLEEVMHMNEKTCCFTGHREIARNEVRAVKAKTKEAVLSLIENGVIYFGAGGARGFDMLAAETVLKAKKKHPQIKLILVLPCENQAEYWSAAERRKYERLKKKADKVKILSQPYYPGCMHARNRHLVDYSAYCICYVRKTSGGAAYTMDYAIKKGLHIIEV